MTGTQLEREISERDPAWRAAADATLEELRNITGVVVAATAAWRSHRALATQGIFVQAVNDYADLIVDASQGRGRTALRSARTLFEHHVAILDVNGDPEMADRWLDHLSTSRLFEPQLTDVAPRLRGKVLQSYRHRMRKLEAHFGPASRQVIDARPGGFQRQWHPWSLFDRAKGHSLEQHYAFYRFASAPVHGSAGGIVGLSREVDSHLVLRHGPAVAVVPYAVLYGTASMRAIIGAAAVYVNGGLDHPLAVLEQLDSEWAGFYEATRRLDDELWPDKPPPGPAALMVVETSGTGRWFEYQPAVERAREARSNSVTMDPRQTPVLDKVLLATTGHLVGVCVDGAVVDSPSDGAWIDVRSVLDEKPITIAADGTVIVPISND